MPSVDELNLLPEDAVRRALRGCCSSGALDRRRRGGRPFAGEGAARRVRRGGGGLTEADLARGARRASPDRRPARRGCRLVQPGAGRRRARRPGRQALAGQRRVRARFGHIYLACATGRSAAELLAFLRERLGNDRETEWRVVAAELAKINQIRLRKLLLGAASGMSALSTHVLDTVRGEPASGVVVRLERAGGGSSSLAAARTDADGRISDFGVASLPAGTYRLVFETGGYLSRGGAGARRERVLPRGRRHLRG